MKQWDAYTESQKIEKLLERTLSENFDRLLQVMNTRERKLSGAGLTPDAKYYPSRHSPDPILGRKNSGFEAKKGKPPAIPYDLKPN